MVAQEIATGGVTVRLGLSEQLRRNIRCNPPRLLFGELDGAFGASEQKFVLKSQGQTVDL